MEEIEYIEHSGRVTSIDREEDTVTVTLTENADCGECPATKLCNNFSPDKNSVTVKVHHAGDFEVGDFVTVRGTERLHRKAIMLATVIPTGALLVVMIGIYLLTRSQLAACLSGLGAMVIFFAGLYLVRNRLAHEFSFEVIPQPSGPALKTENEKEVEQEQE